MNIKEIYYCYYWFSGTTWMEELNYWISKLKTTRNHIQYEIIHERLDKQLENKKHTK